MYQVFYESVFEKCNKGARGEEEIIGANPEIPLIYMGGPHNLSWAASRGSHKQKDESYIHKHMELQHKGRSQTLFYGC